jgi:hypothetical protein
MPDKVQREIEELLDKLDNFVPEERFAAKQRDRKKQERARSGPSAIETMTGRLSGITLGHVMVFGLALFIVAWVFQGPLGDATRWIIIVSMVMTGGAFLFSILNRGRGASTPVMKARPGSVQKVWRGQVIEYDEDPRTMGRLRGLFRRRGRR